MQDHQKLKPKKIIFIGNHLPRQCGIATFTTDLCESVAKIKSPAVECFAIAMNDRAAGYLYPERVRFEIDAINREQYDIASDFINISQADIICLQHEYGIFGGKAGCWILSLLHQVSAPVVATLHTVLKNPSIEQREVICNLAEICDRLVVMSRTAVDFLTGIYGVAAEKIVLIPHGIPDMPFVDPNYFKDDFGLAGKQLIMSFGLLNPGKGIEYVIDALALAVKEVPNVHFMYVGVTHPHIIKEQGEAYRQSLMRKIRRLNLSEHVSFVNRFVSLDELCQYLGAADIYITSYLNEEQITSGTLAYAMGLGKAVVSTPYWYAQEMLAEDRGVLVPFQNIQAIAEQLIKLLQNEVERNAIRKKAYQYCRLMIWPEVARAYMDLFEKVIAERNACPKPVRLLSQKGERPGELPVINLKHMLSLTDSTGIIQHAYFCNPDPRYGYSTDDQARALIVAAKGSVLSPELTEWNELISRYMSYLIYAFDPESRRFGNYLTYQRTWAKPIATEDTHARAVWGLAHVIAYARHSGHRASAAHLMEAATEPIASFSSTRAWALGILAIQTYLRVYPGATMFRKEREMLAHRLFEQYRANAVEDWPWIEDRLTYDNARICQALIEAGRGLPNEEMAQAGLRSLKWLDELQTAQQGHFVPIGSNGWYVRNGTRARFDQQPIEASSFLDACLTAFRLTKDEYWLVAARRAFEWFLGRNDLNLPLYDYVSGACCDGLHPDRVNQNQGAESVICWLMSLLAMYEFQEEVDSQRTREKRHERENG